MNWHGLLMVLLAAAVAWLGFRKIKNSPELFTQEKAGKAVQTLGVLALVLILFIATLVVILKN